MSFLLPPAPPPPPEGAIPFTFASLALESATSLETGAELEPAGRVYVVTSLDATCTEAEPIQCFCDLTLSPPNGVVFHDSQSTGEGLGVSFFWRGQLVISTTGFVQVNLEASGPLNLCAIIGGYILPLPAAALL